MSLPRYLREYKITIELVENGERNAELGESDYIGLRTKLGGKPNYIQDDQNKLPLCPHCFKTMHFVAQIDSVEHKWHTNPNAKDYDDQHFMFGDAGLI